jgi:hypothetical protein
MNGDNGQWQWQISTTVQYGKISQSTVSCHSTPYRNRTVLYCTVCTIAFGECGGGDGDGGAMVYRIVALRCLIYTSITLGWLH